MSLFEDPRYVYRDTFFVLFREENRPTADQVQRALGELGNRYTISDCRLDNGNLESITVVSPYDFSAMDITYVVGEEVQGQVKELLQQFKAITLMGDDAKKLQQLSKANARFDIFHFERMNQEDDDDDQQLDPGGLLLVLERLAELVKGVGLDPQSLSLM
jgi:hypothetical protein